ncbi:MAG TPA: mucoidy inhibitor MuiA family protein [Saprospiraceae bacterium]|nr:mucoidy inhibitor MuiA family protein [Saprospiraceae bacterium]
MKQISKFALLACCLLGVRAEAQQITASEIREVTVYLQGAQVTRQVDAKLVAGVQTLLIKGLAQNIDPNSIRVSSGPGVVLQAVRHEINFLQTAEDRALELKKKRDGLLADANKVNQQITLLKFEKTSLEKNQVQMVAVPNSTSKLEDLKIVLEYQKLRLQDILPKLYEQDKKLQAIQQEIDKVNRQIQDVDQNQNKPSSDIALQVVSKTAGMESFTVQYYVYQANWNMHYDILVKDIQSPLELAYKATVVQNSGEDWNHVKLNLSTANPQEGGVKPELSPWYLRNQPPIAYRMDRQAAPAMQKEMQQADGAAEILVVESEQITSRQYEIELPYTILTNNKPFQVEIKKLSLPAKYQYYAVPKLDRDAFLMAEIEDWETLNLMDGEANIFFEGNYQGKSFISTLSVQEVLKLSLGRDKNLVIERNKIKDFSKNKFLSDKKIINKGWEIIVRNKKPLAVNLILQDQLPISTQKEIVVKPEELSNANYKSETGELSWEMKLNPGEQKKLVLKYSVECPKDYNLVLE